MAESTPSGTHLQVGKRPVEPLLRKLPQPRLARADGPPHAPAAAAPRVLRLLPLGLLEERCLLVHLGVVQYKQHNDAGRQYMWARGPGQRLWPSRCLGRALFPTQGQKLLTAVGCCGCSATMAQEERCAHRSKRAVGPHLLGELGPGTKVGLKRLGGQPVL